MKDSVSKGGNAMNRKIYLFIPIILFAILICIWIIDKDDGTVILRKELSKRDIIRIEVFNDCTGEKAVYENSSEIQDILKIIGDEKLYYDKHIDDGLIGSRVNIKVISQKDIINITYAGGNFIWLYSKDFKPLEEAYYKVDDSVIMFELEDYTNINSELR